MLPTTSSTVSTTGPAAVLCSSFLVFETVSETVVRMTFVAWLVTGVELVIELAVRVAFQMTGRAWWLTWLVVFEVVAFAAWSA